MKNSIIIVGANLTGLCTSLALSSLKQACILIDKKIINYEKNTDGRAIALSYGSKQILEKIGIWNELEAYAGKIEQIRVTDQYSPLFLHFDHQLVENPTLGYLVESHDLQRIMYDKAKNDPLITILDNSKYELLENNQEQVVIKSNEQIFTTNLLIAADGKFSQLRKLANIDYYQHDYKQTAIVCKVKHHLPHNNIAQEMFLPHGPFAILPLKDQHQSGIVWTEKPEVAALLMNMEKDKFNYFLKTKFTDYLEEVELISEIISYPLQLIMAKNYYHNRLMLIGDSAHSVHPIAGQGFNLALRDIEALMRIYQKYSALGFDLGCFQGLSEYQQQRMSDNNAMAFITDGLNKPFSNNIFPINYIRKIGLNAVNQMPMLQKFFMQYAMAKSKN